MSGIMRLLRRPHPSHSPKVLPSQEAYARWAASYPPHAHNPLMQVEEATMKSLLPDLTGRVVLDLACGTGRYGLLALQRGAKLAVGLDNSLAMLRAGALQHIALATAEALPLPALSVDVVLCGLALGHLPHLGQPLREIGRVLKPGGYALISDFHPLLSLSGGQRTFTTPEGEVCAVEHYTHLYADYHQAAGEAGLTIEHVAEPRLEAEHMSKHGNTTPPQKMPVVIVYRLRKGFTHLIAGAPARYRGQ